MNVQQAEWNMGPKIQDASELIVTCDIDWASEACIEFTQSFFENLNVKPVYFITHPSPVLDKIFEEGRAILGLHPNFLPGSDHGETFEEVFNYFKQFPPECFSIFRSHRFFDVTDINVMAADLGAKYDSNQFSFMNKSAPFYYFNGVLRFPSCWEDGTQLRTLGLEKKEAVINMLSSPGVATIGCHPLHIALNSPTFKFNRELKDSLPKADMLNMDEKFLREHRYKNEGISNYLADLINGCKKNGTTITNFSDYTMRIK